MVLSPFNWSFLPIVLWAHKVHYVKWQHAAARGVYVLAFHVRENRLRVTLAECKSSMAVYEDLAVYINTIELDTHWFWVHCAVTVNYLPIKNCNKKTRSMTLWDSIFTSQSLAFFFFSISYEHHSRLTSLQAVQIHPELQPLRPAILIRRWSMP